MQIHNDFDLSQILWYKLGGKAKYFIEATNKDDIFLALDFIQKNNIKKIFFCGLGANLIFTDEYYDGAVVRISTAESQIKKTGETIVVAFAGDLLDNLINFSFACDFTGLEWAGGLPGTIGAAVRGNVGAFGGEIKDSLINADILELHEDGDFSIKQLTNAELNFVYRGSIIKERQGKMVVLSAQFSFKTGTPEEVQKAKEIYQSNIQTRKDRHPLEYPNTGSVFKNIREPEKIQKILAVFPDIKDMIEKKWYGKIAAGYLIQRLGLQGYRVGNAQVSEKHALFIVNLGGAKAAEVLAIIDTIQAKFTETFGFGLEPEAEIVR
jgi:UDP-N-acetylmuramate dehydrogenase